MKWFWLCLLIFAVWLSGFGVAKVVYKHQVPEPTIEYVERVVIQEVEVPVYIEKVVTVTETVEVIRGIVKEVPVRLTDWELDELRAFLEQDDTDSVVYLTPDKDGVFKFANRCEVFALQLIDRVAEQGKRLFFVPLHRMEYYKWYNKTLKEGSYHAVCGAIIGNEFWYIEPSTDRCWHSLNLE